MIDPNESFSIVLGDPNPLADDRFGCLRPAQTFAGCNIQSLLPRFLGNFVCQSLGLACCLHILDRYNFRAGDDKIHTRVQARKPEMLCADGETQPCYVKTEQLKQGLLSKIERWLVYVCLAFH